MLKIELRKKLLLFLISVFSISSVAFNSYSSDLAKNMVLVKEGKFIPPFALTKKFKEYLVKSFLIDKTPVTKKEFLAFITSNSKWQKDSIPSIFEDGYYLSDWNGLNLPIERYEEPITYVSWFAAKAYCKAQEKRLPTDLEWEYASEEPNSTELSWYWKPQAEKLGIVGKDKPNSKGINNFHNLIWEWTYDFNNSVINEDSRETTGDIQKIEAFCGNTGNFKDPKDFPAFARYSFRGSLKANTTLKSLGFRCAKDL